MTGEGGRDGGRNIVMEKRVGGQYSLEGRVEGWEVRKDATRPTPAEPECSLLRFCASGWHVGCVIVLRQHHAASNISHIRPWGCWAAAASVRCGSGATYRHTGSIP